MVTLQQLMGVQKLKEKNSEHVKKLQCVKLSRSTQNGSDLNQ